MTLIRLGHSPDPDDAFMFYALAKDLIPTGDFEFEHLLRDIETLNRWAMEGRLEVSAISVHAYATASTRARCSCCRRTSTTRHAVHREASAW